MVPKENQLFLRLATQNSFHQLSNLADCQPVRNLQGLAFTVLITCIGALAHWQWERRNSHAIMRLRSRRVQTNGSLRRGNLYW